MTTPDLVPPIRFPVRLALVPALALLAAAAAPGVADAQASADDGPAVGKEAPGFTLPDTHGQEHSLEDYRGEWVVLEWFNYGCPYVQKHYESGNIPEQQEKWRERGVNWFAVVSSAPGKQGYHPPDEMRERGEAFGVEADAILLDPEGGVGRAYGARTTPHMFVIDPEGEVVYMGGIDDVPTARIEDLERATQLVDRALEQAMAGEEVTRPTSRPYGCSVKYPDGEG